MKLSHHTHHYGKQITSLSVDDDRLLIGFTDGATVKIWDGGQSCCEYRHMSTDDDLSFYVGSVLTNIEVKDGPDLPSDECHETQFLEVTTSTGHFQVVNHNEHNGYYGGFAICAEDL